MPDTNAVLDAVGMIYDASTDASRWPSVLEELCELTGAPTAAMKQVSLEHGNMVMFQEGRGMDPELYARLPTMMEENLWFQRSHRVPPGRSVVSEQLASPAEIKRTRIYDEILQPSDILHMCGVLVPAKGEMLGTVAVYRPGRAGPFGADTGRILDCLAPHLLRAGEISRATVGIDLYCGGLEAMADAVAFGLLLLDGHGRILFANERARVLLSRGSLRLAADGRLRGPRGAPVSAMRDFLARVRIGREGAGLRLACEGNGELRLIGVPLPERRRESMLPASSACTALFVFSGEARRAPAAALRELWGLTGAETELALRLVAGATLGEIGEQRKLTRNTLKTQLQALFRKSGTSSQAALARVLAEATLPRIEGRDDETP